MLTGTKVHPGGSEENDSSHGSFANPSELALAERRFGRGSEGIRRVAAPTERPH